MTTNNIEFDLNVFKNDELNECDGNDNDNNIESIVKCISIRRLFSALKYYQMLDIIKNKDHRDIFYHFITQIYNAFLNDFSHLINDHNQHLYKINKWLTQNNTFKHCHIKQCPFTARHNEADKDENDKESQLEPELNFFKQTMDSLHFYLFHLYDTGLRVAKIDENNNNNNGDDECEEEKDVYQCFDAEFNRIHQAINDRKYITASFGRFKANNKFNIKINAKQNNNGEGVGDTGDDTTFLDELYKHLVVSGVDDESINKLVAYITFEEFDSESIESDEYNGNISHHINNKNCISSIKQFIVATKSRSGSFSVGLRFYYWPYYERIEKIPKEPQWNMNDHSGYSVCELVVKQKYSSLRGSPRQRFDVFAILVTFRVCFQC